jgi:hypothetical protein
MTIGWLVSLLRKDASLLDPQLFGKGYGWRLNNAAQSTASKMKVWKAK